MPPELVSAFWGLCIAALTAATGILTVIGIYGARYAKEALEDRREDVAAKRRARLVQAGVEAAAIVDEETRGTNALDLSADAKLNRAVSKLMSEPIAATLSPAEATDVVHRGVATLRGSLPYPSTYQVTPSIAPPAELLVPAKLPPPSRVPVHKPRGNT